MVTPSLKNFHKSIKYSGQSIFLYSIFFLFIYLFVFTPLLLAVMEDDAVGMKGYVGYFFIETVKLLVLLLVILGLCKYLIKKKLASFFALFGITLIFITLFYSLIYWQGFGTLDNFIFSNPLEFTKKYFAFDLVVIGLCLFGSYLVLYYYSAIVKSFMLFMLSALVIATISCSYLLSNKISKADLSEVDFSKIDLNYSKTKNNIIIFVMDGAMSGYLPEMFKDDPELLKTYEGFTWYSNSVSTADRTIAGIPAIFGGYEFTVSEINARKSGELLDKVSEAYHLYPENFPQKGYRVRYFDPFWYGFARRGDCQRFLSKYQETCINFIDTVGRKKANEYFAFDAKERTFPMMYGQYIALALFKAVPTGMKTWIYDKANWRGFSATSVLKEDKYISNYMALDSLRFYSHATSNEPSITVIVNNITRASIFLNSECLPGKNLSSSQADINRFDDPSTVQVYQTMLCATKVFGRYLQWFKDNNIYDNSKIIVVSDHGWHSHNPAFKHFSLQQEVAQFQTLLMVKDFNAKGAPVESNEFISNASVPGIVCEVIDGCKSPVSEQIITNKKLSGTVLLHSTPWNPPGQGRYEYIINSMFSVKENIHIESNWNMVNSK